MDGTLLRGHPSAITGKWIVLMGFLVAALGPLYYGCSLMEKGEAVLGRIIEELSYQKHTKIGEEWLREVQVDLDRKTLVKERWVGIKWQQERGPAELWLDPAMISQDDDSVPVEVKRLPLGPLVIQLTSQGVHSYRGLAVCDDHGGPVADEQAVIVRLGDNRLRLVVEFGKPNIDDIDVVFRKP